MESQIDYLPSLPDGWHNEAHAFDGDVMHVVWPDRGAVTIHFKRRNIELGWCIPNPRRRDASYHTGKGWKDRSVMEAVKILQAME